MVAIRATASIDNSQTITLPAGIVAGDLIITYSAIISGGTLNTPSGFTSQSFVSGFSTNSVDARVCTKVAVGGESGTVLTLNTGGSLNMNIVLVIVGNPGFATPFGGVGSGGTVSATSPSGTPNTTKPGYHLVFEAGYTDSQVGAMTVNAAAGWTAISGCSIRGNSSYEHATIYLKDVDDAINTTSQVVISAGTTSSWALSTVYLASNSTFAGAAAFTNAPAIMAVPGKIGVSASLSLTNGTSTISLTSQIVGIVNMTNGTSVLYIRGQKVQVNIWTETAPITPTSYTPASAPSTTWAVR